MKRKMTDLAFGAKCGTRGRKGLIGSICTAGAEARALVRKRAPRASAPKPPVTAPRKSRREQFGQVNMVERQSSIDGELWRGRPLDCAWQATARQRDTAFWRRRQCTRISRSAV